MAITLDTALSLLDRALEEELGLYLRTEDAKAYRNELDNHKRELTDPAYDKLMTFVPSVEELYIVKKDVTL
jgi:hypothetical protein